MILRKVQIPTCVRGGLLPLRARVRRQLHREKGVRRQLRRLHRMWRKLHHYWWARALVPVRWARAKERLWRKLQVALRSRTRASSRARARVRAREALHLGVLGVLQWLQLPGGSLRPVGQKERRQLFWESQRRQLLGGSHRPVGKERRQLLGQSQRRQLLGPCQAVPMDQPVGGRTCSGRIQKNGSDAPGQAE